MHKRGVWLRPAHVALNRTYYYLSQSGQQTLSHSYLVAALTLQQDSYLRHLFSFSGSDNNVVIAGKTCTIQTQSTTQITCMTAANLGNTVQADVEVYAASNGRAVQVWTHFQKKIF